MKRRKRETVYFAHPISMYRTLKELVIVEALHLRDLEVINPGDPSYQRAYDARRLANPEESPMQFWIELAAKADRCVFTHFPSIPEVPGVQPIRKAKKGEKPKVGAGVVKEVDRMIVLRRLVQWVHPEATAAEDVELFPFRGWKEFQCLTPDETRAMLRLFMGDEYAKGK